MASTSKGTFHFQCMPDLPHAEWNSYEVQTWMQILTRTVKFTYTDDETLTPSAFSTITSDQTFTIAGLIPYTVVGNAWTDMHVYVMPPDLPAGVGIAYVNIPAKDTLKIRFFNLTGGSVTPTSGLYHITAIQH